MKRMLVLAMVALVTACTCTPPTTTPTTIVPQPTATSEPPTPPARPTQTPTPPPCSPILYDEPVELFAMSAQGRPFQISSADFNGDELMDIVIARGIFATSSDFELIILLNDGAGGLVEATADAFVDTIPKTQHPRQTVLADFNGDGVTDIFIADHGQDADPFPGYQNALVLSAPDGKVVDATANLPQQSDFTHSAAAADIDSDGDIDLFVGNLCGQKQVPPQIWLNDGLGNFTIADGLLPPRVEDMNRDTFTASVFSDVNNDGSPDLVLGADDLAMYSLMLINDGNGSFSILPDAFPLKPLHAKNIVVYIKPTDINRDAYQDLMFVNVIDWYRGRYIQMLINNGDGTFRDETATRLPQEYNDEQWLVDIALHDIDSDGDLDITSRSQPWVSSCCETYYLNDGNGYYSQPSILDGFDGPHRNGIHYTFIDLDGDGGLDGVAIIPPMKVFLIRDSGCSEGTPMAEASPTTSLQPTSTPTLPPPPPFPDIIVFDGELARGWEKWGWNGEEQIGRTYDGFGERRVLEITLQPHGVFTLSRWNWLDVSPFSALAFKINTGQAAGQRIGVTTLLQETPTGPTLDISDYIEASQLEPEKWHQVVVPLSELAPDSREIKRIDISDLSGSGASTFCIHDVRFVVAGP